MEYRAKETFYNGTNYRSRNEAKWARFFDLVRIKYVYEPIVATGWNGERYKPDFFFPEYEKYAEVKSNANGIQNETMARKLNGVIDYQSSPISNGLLLLGAFPFDVRVNAIRLKTKWLFWNKGVCCGDAYIQQQHGGREAEILFTESNIDCGCLLPPSASPDIYVEPFVFGTFTQIAINDTNDFFNNGEDKATLSTLYNDEIPF